MGFIVVGDVGFSDSFKVWASYIGAGNVGNADLGATYLGAIVRL